MKILKIVFALEKYYFNIKIASQTISFFNSVILCFYATSNNYLVINK